MTFVCVMCYRYMEVSDLYRKYMIRNVAALGGRIHFIYLNY